MKSQIQTSIVCILFVLAVSSGCSDASSDQNSTASSQTKHLVKADSVGEYRIGQSTLDTILGSDTAENRKRFSDAGLSFEFNNGRILTGITVASNEYALDNGLAVGSSSSDVIKKLGEPKETKVELGQKGIELDALVYENFLFLLDSSKHVAAIRIGN